MFDTFFPTAQTKTKIELQIFDYVHFTRSTSSSTTVKFNNNTRLVVIPMSTVLNVPKITLYTQSKHVFCILLLN